MSASRSPGGRPRLPLLLVAVAVAVLVVGVAGVAYMFSGSAPAAVSLGGADPTSLSDPASASAPTLSAPTSSASSASGSGSAPSASDSASSPSPAAASTPNAAVGAVSSDGTWTVDPSIGSFSDFSGSFVGYRVAENLANVGSTTAVGRTPKVSGSLTLQGSTVTAAEFTADLTSLQSDKPMRDGTLHRQALETDQFPTATFQLTTPIRLPTAPADGASWSVTATGKLTLHGVTRDVSIPLQAKLSGGVVTVVGSTEITFADYGIAPPQSMMVLSVADHGTLELQLHFRHG